MKQLFAGFLLCALTACNSVEEQSQSEANTPAPTMDKLFDFAETVDKSYCNPDSIIAGDCGGGDLYFTKKGNVFYSFSCMGADSTTFEVGQYSMSDTSIDCVFTQAYSFYDPSEPIIGENGEVLPEPKVDPNAGKLIEKKAWALHLKKLNCSGMEYGFLDNTERYVVKPFSGDQEQYFATFKKIKVFASF